MPDHPTPKQIKAAETFLCNRGCIEGQPDLNDERIIKIVAGYMASGESMLKQIGEQAAQAKDARQWIDTLEERLRAKWADHDFKRRVGEDPVHGQQGTNRA